MSDVNGNTDAVKLIEQFADISKKDRSGYAVVVTAREPAQFSAGFSGTVELERVALDGLKKIQEAIESNILNRTLPDPDPSLDASYVCYNITCSPVSFDFTTWLIEKEMTRIREGAPGPLKVGFWLGRDGKTGLGGDQTSRQKMLDNVCRPALDLLGAIEHPKGTRGRFLEFFSYKPIVEASRKGEAVPKFRSNTSIDLEPGYVTITLRECDYWAQRNSKVSEWLKFAKYLKDKGERVIFVRDTAKADEPLEGYQTSPRASRDLIYRMALYENAKCNCFVSNGPVSLAFFSDRPWLKFMELNDGGDYNAATSKYWKECAGLDVGEQWPWSTDKQVITWKPDYFTNMVLAWEDLGL